MKLAPCLVTLAASLTLFGAQALTITPQQPSLPLPSAGTATARFDFDFGPAALEFYAMALDFSFNTTLVSADVRAITLSFSDGTPDFSLGQMRRVNHDAGATISWVVDIAPDSRLSGAPALPAFVGSGVLSVVLGDVGLSGGTPLNVDWQIATLEQDVGASAQLDLVSTAAAVPEPPAWTLAVLGGCWLIGRRRRAAR